MATTKFNWYEFFVQKNNQDPLNICLNENNKIIFIGDIHEQDKLYDKLISKISKFEYLNKNTILVSLGDLFDKGPGPEYGLKIYKDLIKKNAYILYGNHEAKKVNKKDKSLPLQELNSLPRVLSFYFEGLPDRRLTAMHAGVTPNHSFNDLKYSDDVIYVREIDEEGKAIPLIWVEENGIKKLVPKKPNGVNWHEVYDGRHGYIVSGHQMQKDGLAKFYKNSCNIDSGAYETGVLTAAVFDKNGLIELITT